MMRKTVVSVGIGTLVFVGLLFGTFVSGQSSESTATGVITGTVKDQSGAPFRGAFVRARNVALPKIATIVLSDKEGHYRFDNLQPGGYEVWASAVGYDTDGRGKVTVKGATPVSEQLTLKKGKAKWSDLSHNQATKLLPEGEGKKALFSNKCFICHGFQTRMATKRMDEAGWTRAVNFMRTSMKARLVNTVSDKDAAGVISYLTTIFGVDSSLPRSPEDMPEYKSTVRPFGDDGMKIVFVEYDLPGRDRIPFSAYPDNKGNVWISSYGTINRIGRLNPKTGETAEFAVPNQGTAGIHSVVADQDGNVWIAEQLANKLAKFDPKTQKMTEYPDEPFGGRGQKHTARVDSKGGIWASGAPITRFDPKTEKFKQYTEVPYAYDIQLDAAENVWFAIGPGPQIGMIDVKTGEVTKFDPPTPNSYPRRLAIDRDGMIWFSQFNVGKIGRFDPKTKTFKEFPLPGPNPGPYPIAIDRDNYIWYAGDNSDSLGRLDPKTGHVTEYPFPYSEIMIKELFLDSEGRMWFGSTGNDKVGYFTVKN